MKTYVVKIQLKDDPKPCLVNQGVIIPECELNKTYHNKQAFMMELVEAKELMLNLISRSKGSYKDLDLNYISLIKVSPYKPYVDYEVINYQEF